MRKVRSANRGRRRRATRDGCGSLPPLAAAVAEAPANCGGTYGLKEGLVDGLEEDAEAARSQHYFTTPAFYLHTSMY
jgi:hypothetical protein